MMLDRTVRPTFHPIEGIPFLQPQKLHYKNGLKMFLFNSSSQDIIRLQWVFQSADFNPDNPLINLALAEMLLEGTKKYSSAQIAETADFFGAFLYPEYNLDQITLTLFSLTKHIDKLIPLVYDILNNCTFPKRELQTFVKTHKQRMRVLLERNDYLARREFQSTLFGNNRYGYSYSESDFDKLECQDLKSAFDKCIVPKNCDLFVSGNIEVESLKKIKEIFGEKWERSGERSDRKLVVVDVPPSELIVIEKKDSLQSAIRIGNRTISRSHPDFPGLQFLNTVLGGYFGSRLMTNIREHKGYTYGIGSGIVSMEFASYLTIASEVRSDVGVLALNEIEAEINRLNCELIGTEELILVRNYILGSLMGSLENVFSHTDKFKQVYFSGLTLEYYLYFTEIINTITAKELRTLANDYLNFDKMVKVIVGVIS